MIVKITDNTVTGETWERNDFVFMRVEHGCKLAFYDGVTWWTYPFNRYTVEIKV